MSRAAPASSSAVIKRRCALANRFFARRNFSFVASICASVRNIFDADFLVGSRPICRFCCDNFVRNCRNFICSSSMLARVLAIVSRAFSAPDSATAKRSAAARRTESSRKCTSAVNASVKSSPFSYALIKLSYSANPLYSISSF